MLALLISTLSYVIFVVFAGAAAVRDASGNITDVINGTTVLPCTENCTWGLFNSYSVSALFSLLIIFTRTFEVTDMHDIDQIHLFS